MQVLDLEDDVYYLVLVRAGDAGLNVSEFLRKQLNGPGGNLASRSAPQPKESTLQKVEANPRQRTKEFQELDTFLQTPAFLVHSDGIGRFVELLGFIYKRSPNKFDSVLSITGDSRKYFAKSRKEIEDSGNSVMPKEIPGSPFWVVGNTSTKMKQEMLRRVLQILGYPQDSISLAERAVMPTIFSRFD